MGPMRAGRCDMHGSTCGSGSGRQTALLFTDLGNTFVVQAPNHALNADLTEDTNMKKAGGSSGTRRRRKANRARTARKSEALSDAVSRTGMPVGRASVRRKTVQVAGLSLPSPLQQQRLEREVNEQGQQIEELFEFFAKASVRRVRNAASFILLVAAGEPFCITPPSRYRVLGASDECVKAAAAAMGVEAQESVDIADGIVTCRRVDVDPIDVETLWTSSQRRLSG